MRAGRFRHQLINQTFVGSPTFNELEDALCHFHTQWRKGNLTDPEWTAVYLVLFGIFHRPRNFIGGSLNRKTNCAAGTLTNKRFLSYFALAPTWAKHFPPEQKFLETVCNRSLRSIPLTVNKTLAAWSLGNYPLLLREDIPSVDEVLEMQTQGRRCVSVLMDPRLLRSFFDGRDAMSFAIHDLLHADHFFHDPVQARAQIEFLRRLQRAAHIDFLRDTRASDTTFRADWEYLIADMNTVPLHLFKTFKAFILKAVKRRFQTPPDCGLEPAGEIFFKDLLRKIAQTFDFDAQETAAWLSLNDADFIFPEQAVTLTRSVQKEDGYPPLAERAAAVKEDLVFVVS